MWSRPIDGGTHVLEPDLNRADTTPDDLVRLLALVARQDRAAFAQLYAATSAKLYGTILRILRRRDLADEILQEVYVKIWQHAGKFETGRASPISWMATIARNRALDEVRRKVPIALDDMPGAMEIPDGLPLASETVERAQELQRLMACLGGLEPEKAEIVKLAYLGGLSREELGQRFGHPVATIKTWLHRSLKQLKDCLGS